MVFKKIKIIIVTVIYGYAIYTIFGMSLQLLGACLNSVMKLLLHMKHRRNYQIPKDQENGEELRLRKEAPTRMINEQPQVHMEVTNIQKRIEIPQAYPSFAEEIENKGQNKE